MASDRGRAWSLGALSLEGLSLSTALAHAKHRCEAVGADGLFDNLSRISEGDGTGVARDRGRAWWSLGRLSLSTELAHAEDRCTAVGADGSPSKVAVSCESVVSDIAGLRSC